MTNERSVPDQIDAAGLKALYERELIERLQSPADERDDPPGVRLLIAQCRLTAPAALVEPGDARVWIWSDLHLGHAETIRYFRRPFASPDEMDNVLFDRWERTVGPDDTIVCLGDVAPDDGLTAEHIGNIIAAPGRKLLVLGNHDRRHGGFDEVSTTLYAPGDPPLLLTHLPLRVAPTGCVNVHGHVHESFVTGTSPHINVTVEQLDYRPVGLDRIRRLARSLAAGHPVYEETTTQALKRLDKADPR